jgi:hypothetical protein
MFSQSSSVFEVNTEESLIQLPTILAEKKNLITFLILEGSSNNFN